MRANAHPRIFSGRCICRALRKWKRGNERRRSLCDGGGRAVFWKKHRKMCRAHSKCLKYRRHKSTNLANASQTVCLGGGGDEPMRERKGADAQPLAMSPSTMRQWLRGHDDAHDQMQLSHSVHVWKLVGAGVRKIIIYNIMVNLSAIISILLKKSRVRESRKPMQQNIVYRIREINDPVGRKGEIRQTILIRRYSRSEKTATNDGHCP
jgi:hypothetical protein